MAMATVNIESTEKIKSAIESALDNQDCGFVYDYDVVSSGQHNGLAHNGLWMRIIKLSEDTVAYSYQSDSHDDDFATGDIEDVVEWIASCAASESDKTDMYEVEYHS